VHYLFPDRSNQKVTGVIITQLLPFADPNVLDLFTKFDSGLYRVVTPA